MGVVEGQIERIHTGVSLSAASPNGERHGADLSPIYSVTDIASPSVSAAAGCQRWAVPSMLKRTCLPVPTLLCRALAPDLMVSGPGSIWSPTKSRGLRRRPESDSMWPVGQSTRSVSSQGLNSAVAVSAYNTTLRDPW
jgi:hypothetical protein